MALGAREMLIVVRARDEASKVFNAVGRSIGGLSNTQMQAAQRQMALGGAMVGVGTALAGVGLAGLAALNDMTDAAADYATQVALTKTQVDDLGISAQQLGDIGKRVGSQLPVTFKDIQPALYDIFSSIEVSAPQAEQLLMNIGKAAVGGKTDMVTSGKAIIGILNAYKIPVEQAGKVTDTLFQLVKDGVGSYEEFAVVLGKAMPSAIKAGQSIESLAGMFAFMTRNGMSAAEAATSAARALDAMSNPKVIARFKDMGIEVADAAGNFRPVNEVMGELKAKLAGLDDVSKAGVLKDLFKGAGGTIQAMRFFSMAVDDSNGLLDLLTNNMNNAGGAAQAAYDIMKAAPLSAIQLMNNKWEILKITIGEKLLPAKLKLYAIITKIIDVFLNLSPAVQSFIVKAVVIGSILAVLIGTVTAVAGLFIMFAAGVTMAGFTLAGVAIAIGIAVGAIIAIGVAVFFVIKYWDQIKAKALEIWPYIRDVILAVVDKIIESWNWLVNAAIAVWPMIVSIVEESVKNIIRFWNWLVNTSKDVWNRILAVVIPVIDRLINAWGNLVVIGKYVWGALTDIVISFLPVFGMLVDAAKMVWGYLKEFWDAVVPEFVDALDVIWHTVQDVFDAVVNKAEDFYNAVVGSFRRLGQELAGFADLMGPTMEAASHIWNATFEIIKSFSIVMFESLNQIAAFVSFVMTATIGFFMLAWRVIGPLLILIGNRAVDTFAILVDAVRVAVKIVIPIFNVLADVGIFVFRAIMNIITMFVGIFRDVIGIIVSLINGDWGAAFGYALDIIRVFGDFLVSTFLNLVTLVLSVIGDLISGVVGFFASLGPLILDVLKGFINSVIDFFKFLWDVLVGHSIIPDLINSIIDWFASLPGKVIAFVVQLVTDAITWFGNLATSVLGAIVDFIERAVAFYAALPGRIISAIGALGSLLLQAGEDVIQGLWDGAQATWNLLIDWVDGLAALIITFLGLGSQTLYNIGKDIIQGFWNGMLDVWDKLKDFVSGIAGWITDHKGPPARDRVLLKSAGLLIMQGLQNGLEDGWKNVANYLDTLDPASLINGQTQYSFDYNGTPNGAGNAPSGGSSGSISGPSGAGNSSGNVYFMAGSVVTQEIDPRKHAADLGWEMAVRADGG